MPRVWRTVVAEVVKGRRLSGGREREMSDAYIMFRSSRGRENKVKVEGLRMGCCECFLASMGGDGVEDIL